MITFKLLITGPKEYLKDGVLVEDLEITAEEIEELREEGETDNDVIQYILEEEINGWAQRWCRCQAFTLNEWQQIKKNNLFSVGDPKLS